MSRPTRKVQPVEQLLLGVLAAGFGVTVILGVLNLLGWVTVEGVAGLSRVDLTREERPVRQVTLQMILSLAEVFLTGGIILAVVKRFFQGWKAVLLASAAFGLLHFARPHASMSTLLVVGVTVGLSMLCLYVRQGFLAALGWHFTWNVLLGPGLGLVVAGQQRTGWFNLSLDGSALWTGGRYGVEGSLTACLVSGLLVGLLTGRKPP